MPEADQSVPQLNNVWGWTGLDAVEIFGFGFFGDVLALGRDGAVWAVCPAKTNAHPVTDDPAQVAQMRALANPTSDLFHEAIIEELAASLGKLDAGDIYAMQYPASVGGNVEADNFRVEPFWDYHMRMSDLGRKLRDAGPGATMLVTQGPGGEPVLEPVPAGQATSEGPREDPQPVRKTSWLGRLFGSSGSR